MISDKTPLSTPCSPYIQRVQPKPRRRGMLDYSQWYTQQSTSVKPYPTQSTYDVDPKLCVVRKWAHQYCSSQCTEQTTYVFRFSPFVRHRDVIQRLCFKFHPNRTTACWIMNSYTFFNMAATVPQINFRFRVWWKNSLVQAYQIW